MPVYCFRCEKCGAVSEEMFPMRAVPPEIACVCGARAGRSIAAEHAPRPAKAGLAAWPIVSAAAGLHPAQIAEDVAQFPHHEYTPKGDMVFRDPTHRRRCLRDIGMIDRAAWC